MGARLGRGALLLGPLPEGDHDADAGEQDRVLMIRRVG
jgi:hypothetical protein